MIRPNLKQLTDIIELLVSGICAEWIGSCFQKLRFVITYSYTEAGVSGQHQRKAII